MKTALGKAEIEAILPHREPFLLIDEVVELEPGERVVARKTVRPDEWYLAGHFPGRPVMPGVLIVEAMAQTGAVAVLSQEENRGRLALFAGIDDVRFKRIVEPGDELELECTLEAVRGPIGRGKATATRGRRARCARDPHVRGGAMIGTANGVAASITGLGCRVPERVVTNDDLSTMMDTSDEWIQERTGIRERRIAGPDEALSDLCLPAAKEALEDAGVKASEIDLLIVATVTPDMAFPATAAILADQLGAEKAGAYDLSAGCTGFMYAVAQAYGMLAGGLAKKTLVVGGDVLSKIMDWSDRRTSVLFGDGAGAVVMELVNSGGFLGFELGADGSGGPELYVPGGGSRHPASAESVAEHLHFVRMNGREVYKFATRVLVSSAEAVLAECGRTIDEVDVYVPHQANVRIIEHARKKLGIPEDRVVIDVDRYGNTSSGSIPLALADARKDGRLEAGKLVLMTGMGAGLTWGSGLIEWTDGGRG